MNGNDPSATRVGCDVQGRIVFVARLNRNDPSVISQNSFGIFENRGNFRKSLVFCFASILKRLSIIGKPPSGKTLGCKEKQNADCEKTNQNQSGNGALAG